MNTLAQICKLIPLIFIGGCCSLVNITNPGLPIYGGLSVWSKAFDKYDWVLERTLLLIDLPFTFVFDTLLLPIALLRELFV